MQQIINDIINFMSQWGGAYGDWYIGITSDSEQRLFNDHGVNRANDAWIYRTANTSDDARSIEQYFIGLGCDGGSGGGDNTSRIVYVYKKSSRTNP